MSGEPHSQKSGWINTSNERIFQVKDNEVLPVMANIAQSLIGDWERIAVADPDGVQRVRPLPAITYPMKMK